MPSSSKNDIVLVRYPFSDMSGAKVSKLLKKTIRNASRLRALSHVEPSRAGRGRLERLGRGSSGVEGCRRHPESLAKPLDVLSCKPSLPSEDLRNNGLSPKLLGEIVLA
jgi:hypothetical protein